MIKEQNNKSLNEFDATESMAIQDEEKNEFLDEAFQYENCPNCQRNFFMGKLKYHLKLCKPNQPMTKTPLRKTKRTVLQRQAFNSTENKELTARPLHDKKDKQSSYEKCSVCKANVPVYMKASHQEKCAKNLEQYKSQGQEMRSKTKIQFNKNQRASPSILPRIQNSAKQRKFSEKRKNLTDLKQLGEYTVKVREDLSCFKKALQVQQIQCGFCGRRFSRQASLRHIPICEKLKLQQKHSLVLNKHCKSELYRSNVPVKNTLFRKKFTDNASNLQKQMTNSSFRTARMFKSTNAKNSARGQEHEKVHMNGNVLKKINEKSTLKTKVKLNPNIKKNEIKEQRIFKQPIAQKQPEMADQSANYQHLQQEKSEPVLLNEQLEIDCKQAQINQHIDERRVAASAVIRQQQGERENKSQFEILQNSETAFGNQYKPASSQFSLQKEEDYAQDFE